MRSADIIANLCNVKEWLWLSDPSGGVLRTSRIACEAAADKSDEDKKSKPTQTPFLPWRPKSNRDAATSTSTSSTASTSTTTAITMTTSSGCVNRFSSSSATCCLNCGTRIEAGKPRRRLLPELPKDRKRELACLVLIRLGHNELTRIRILMSLQKIRRNSIRSGTQSSQIRLKSHGHIITDKPSYSGLRLISPPRPAKFGLNKRLGLLTGGFLGCAIK